ncbi:MAG: sporulation protein [Rhodoferax sp.]|nr:sporulation protein [Rhodoferax sp.]
MTVPLPQFRPSSRLHQAGSTLSGFIVGLLVGLAAALAVAVYVTKVPVPFINKGQNRSPGQDAAETEKNRNWDPNAPLYGKNPARPASAAGPAASEAAPVASAAAPAVQPAPQTPAVPPAVAPGKAEARPGPADPLGDLARAKAAATEPFVYFVQTGAFRSAEEAESQRAKLSLAGVEARVSDREQSGRTVFRVRVGPLDRREEADRMKDKLDASGFETVLVRTPR